MKTILFSFFFAAACSAAAAQDLIVLNDKHATDIIAKVIRISDTSVEYREWNNPEGPIRKVPVHKVLFIRYPDGKKEFYSNYYSYSKWMRPKYQGEFAMGYAAATSKLLEVIPLNRLMVETVHGVRFNPIFFLGAGVGYNYFHTNLAEIFDIMDSDEEALGSMTPLFISGKFYYPIKENFALQIAVDLGGIISKSGYLKNIPNKFYATIGPSISFGDNLYRSFDFSIRFQHMGTGFNAILFRIGFGF